MIPPFNAAGELPAGIHTTTLDEMESVFSTTPRRRALFDGLVQALNNLKSAGVHDVFIDGSFVTAKTSPNDVDGCWQWHEGVDVDRLDAVFLDFSDHRQAMGDKYGVDFFIADWVEAGSGLTFLEFFQRNRNDEPRGILKINLREIS